MKRRGGREGQEKTQSRRCLRLNSSFYITFFFFSYFEVLASDPSHSPLVFSFHYFLVILLFHFLFSCFSVPACLFVCFSSCLCLSVSLSFTTHTLFFHEYHNPSSATPSIFLLNALCDLVLFFIFCEQATVTTSSALLLELLLSFH